MDDAREWIVTAPDPRALRAESVPPGDPWGAPLRRTPETARPIARTVPRAASLWRRGTALALDLLAIGLLRVVGDALAQGIDALAPTVPALAEAFRISWRLVVPVAYFVLAHGTGGQTLGKRVLGIRVVGARGEPIGYLQALGRVVGTVAAALPGGLGLALAAVRSDRRGAHDLLAGTRVVRARDSREPGE
jgi:uncharacterized RDD family membrane protein YckC